MTNFETQADPTATMSMVRIGLAIAMMTVLFAAILFGPARRLDWTLGWIYLSIFVISIIISWVCLLRWNPELIEWRMRLGQGTKTWDKVWTVLFAPVLLTVYVVAGLEARGGMGSLPPVTWLFGLVIFTLGWAIFTGSMVVNPFFEKTVRIQTERGQHVIDTGPYAYVRHPGYVGFIGWVMSIPFLLSSVWAFVPALLSVACIILRTALEDRTLKAELPGYSEYMRRVRFRLVPGVW